MKLPILVSAVTLAGITALTLLEVIPMTVAGIIAIVILAFTNAWASMSEARLMERFAVVAGEVAVVPGGSWRGFLKRVFGDSGYVRKFIKVEAFWRAFTTNLSFGGVSLALAIIAFKSDWNFWDWNNAVLPLLLNFVMGIFSPRQLRDEYEAMPSNGWIVVVFVAGFYLYAAWSAFWLYVPPAT